MNLYTKESGSGQPMVLLHGNGEDSSYFVNQISFFESKYLVMADLRVVVGHLPWNGLLMI